MSANEFKGPPSTVAMRVSNSSDKVVVYEFDDVIIFLKPGAALEGAFTGSENPPKSTGTLPEWPQLSRADS